MVLLRVCPKSQVSSIFLKIYICKQKKMSGNTVFYKVFMATKKTAPGQGLLKEGQECKPFTVNKHAKTAVCSK